MAYVLEKMKQKNEAETVVNTASGDSGGSYRIDAWKAASYSDHLQPGYIQSVQALACVNEIMTLD